jgi:hypothetical protein
MKGELHGEVDLHDERVTRWLHRSRAWRLWLDRYPPRRSAHLEVAFEELGNDEHVDSAIESAIFQRLFSIRLISWATLRGGIRSMKMFGLLEFRLQWAEKIGIGSERPASWLPRMPGNRV